MPKGSSLRITRSQVKQLQFDNIVNNGSGKTVECVDGTCDGEDIEKLTKDIKWLSIDDVYAAGKWKQ